MPKKSYTTEQFISKAQEVHGNKYDYSLVKYENNYTKVDILCSKHGIFQQHSSNHIGSKSGCPKCFHEISSKSKQLSQENFINKANTIHNFKYNYSKANYTNYNNKINIICPYHGEFIQLPSNHLNQKSGCPKCNISKGELIIKNFLEKNNIKYFYNYTFKGFKNPKTGYSLYYDFYIPEQNVCIEFDGKQHFEESKFFKRSGGFEGIKYRDQLKNDFCKENDIKLIRIPYNKFNIEQILNKEIVN